MWSIVFHVGMSVVVLQVFRRGLGWLGLVIAAHALLDFLAVGPPLLLGLQGTTALLVPEAIVTVAGLISLWVLWSLRDPPAEALVAVGTPSPGQPPLAAGARPDPPDQEE